MLIDKWMQFTSAARQFGFDHLKHKRSNPMNPTVSGILKSVLQHFRDFEDCESEDTDETDSDAMEDDEPTHLENKTLPIKKPVKKKKNTRLANKINGRTYGPRFDTEFKQRSGPYSLPESVTTTTNLSSNRGSFRNRRAEIFKLMDKRHENEDVKQYNRRLSLARHYLLHSSSHQ